MAGNSVGGGQIIAESHAHNHHYLTKAIGVLVSFFDSISHYEIWHMDSNLFMTFGADWLIGFTVTIPYSVVQLCVSNITVKL